MSDLSKYIDFAVETAHLAGKETLHLFQSGVETEFKVDNTPVTEADRRSELLIRSRIEDTFPNHGVLGEEFGEMGSGESHRWVIDPIDGTKAFSRGVPLYGVLIGLEIEGNIEVGVSHFPGLGETVYAASGVGCFWNGRRCNVAGTTSLEHAYLSCTDPSPNQFAKYEKGDSFARMQEAVYHRAGWSDAYGHALVATGRIEVMLDPILEPWDAAPFPVILREAGGYFGDWEGTETIYGREGMSTTRVLLEEVLKTIRGETSL
ncbi:MAG: inositol monophosphatase family protein [Deinococcales bacterium]|nr:inositol monophosphatase family protein [Deinococcales bacterium]